MSQKHTWHKIAESIKEITFSAEGIASIEVNTKKCCVILYKDQLYACASNCPHAGGTLAEGYIDVVGNIVCPVHRYKFSIQNGRNISGEGYFLKTYPVEQREDGIYIALPNPGLFSF